MWNNRDTEQLAFAILQKKKEISLLQKKRICCIYRTPMAFSPFDDMGWHLTRIFVCFSATFPWGLELVCTSLCP